MKQQDDIFARIGRNDGTTVPEGYFEDFAARMAAKLPAHPATVVADLAPRSWWSRLRPYVYMAAMFAGIWLMMNMFGMFRPSGGTDLSIDSNPTLVAALDNDAFMSDYYLDHFDDYDLMEEMIDEGTAPAFDPSAIDDATQTH